MSGTHRNGSHYDAADPDELDAIGAAHAEVAVALQRLAGAYDAAGNNYSAAFYTRRARAHTDDGNVHLAIARARRLERREDAS